MLLVAEFRKLNAPELLQDVKEGAEYRDETEFESTSIGSGTLPDSFTHLLTQPLPYHSNGM